MKNGFTPLEIRRCRRLTAASGRLSLTGFTTGTCAQAATKGACIMLKNREKINQVEVETACGTRFNFSLSDQKIGKDFARCSVIKRSGEEPDVTDGARIFSQVKLSAKKGIIIKGAKGVGKVTKPGLAVPIGEWAINPVPRRMILKEASKFLAGEKGLEVTISVPAGAKLARRTYNPRLGIVGGISIIGTTGIILPKSLNAYKASLALELNVLKAQGYKRAVFVFGYVGERFCKDMLKLKDDEMVKIGDHVGFMLEDCVRKRIKDVLLVGHIGKMIKVANGQFNTHCSFGDQRLSSIARYAKLYGASNRTIEDILKEKTAEAAIRILNKAGLGKVFERIAQDASAKAVGLANNKIKVDCVILSLKGKVLGKT